jgi:hypothetical protein
VTTGFFGPATLDNALGTRARNLCFIVDPLEARAIWFGLRRLISILDRIGASDSQPVLRTVQEAIERYVPAFATDVTIDWRFESAAAASGFVNHLTDAVESGFVAILLSDGTRLDVHENARFEVLNASARRLKTVSARELNRGDEIIILADSHALFSDRLLNVLDTGQLAAAAEARRTWLEVVRAVFDARRRRVADIARTMQEDGFEVKAFNVRSWLRRDPQNTLVPDRLDKFLSFARALGVSLPEEVLPQLYAEILRLRHAHRRCGRYLARAIRGAYSGRLDAPTLARIERDWGMSCRQLMEAAEQVTVEDVLKSGPADVTH